MRTLEEYMALNYRLEVQRDEEEGGYVMSFPELPGCVSCADTQEEVLRLAEDAKKEWLAAAMEQGIEIPIPKGIVAYPNTFKLRLPKSLYAELNSQARREGISMNQYCLYLLSRRPV